MAADTEPLEILLHLPLLCEDKVKKFMKVLLSMQKGCLDDTKPFSNLRQFLYLCVKISSLLCPDCSLKLNRILA